MYRLPAAILSAALFAAVIILRAAPINAASTVTANLAVAPTSISCSGSTTVTLTLDGVADPGMIDLLLVLDSSISVTGAGWAKQKEAAIAMVNSLTFGPDDVQVGVVSFSESIRTLIGLSATKSAVVDAITDAPFLNGRTFTKDAVLRAEELLNEGRANAKRVIVFITDGSPNPTVTQDPTTEAARIQAQPNWLMIGIGVSNAVDDATLHALASNPDSTYAYRALTFDDLAATLAQVVALLTESSATELGYSMTAGSDFTLTNPTASAGTVTPTGNSFSWSLRALLGEQVTLSYTLEHTGARSGALPLHQVATLTYTGSSGPVTTSYTNTNITVAICDPTPPLVTPTITGTLGANGWYTTNVTVAWTATDPESSITSPACAPTTITANTAGQMVSCTATSIGGTTTETVTIKRDADPPPAPTPSVSPAANVAGWHNATPVNVSFPAPADTGPSGGVTCTSATSVTTDTAGTLISGSCTDAAGNTSAPGSATVKIDTTRPVITGARITPANSNGWNNGPVQIAFTCADAGPAQSGIATNTVTNVTVSTPGENQSVTNSGVCIDRAGNSAAPATVSGISIINSTGLPEFAYQFDPASRGVQVIGLSGSGAPLTTTGPVNPTTCTTQRTGRICIYRVSDLAGNAVTVTLQITESANQTRVRVTSLQYSGRPAITPLSNETVYDYRLTGGTLASLVQSVTVTTAPGSGMPSGTRTVRATWDGATTTITFVTPSAPAQTVSGAQPLLIRVASSNGTLLIDTNAAP